MIKIAICDDNPEILRLVVDKVRAYLQESSIFASIQQFGNGNLLSYDLHEENHFDLILLDVEMPGSKDGMQVAAEINKLLPRCLIIFLTSHSKYAIDAFKVTAFRYNLKNRIEEDLENNLAAAINRIKVLNRRYYTISNNSYLEKIPYDEILYIKKDKKNSILHTREKRTVSTRKSLAIVLEELNSEDFIFIDRSCIANITQISKVQKGEAYFEDGEVITISRPSLNKVKDTLNRYWGSLL